MIIVKPNDHGLLRLRNGSRTSSRDSAMWSRIARSFPEAECLPKDVVGLFTACRKLLFGRDRPLDGPYAVAGLDEGIVS